MELITERLLLREMTAEDFDALYRVLGDSDTMRHYPYTFDEARVRNRAFASTPFRRLYSYMKKDNLPSSATARSIGMHRDHDYTDQEGELSSVYFLERK